MQKIILSLILCLWTASAWAFPPGLVGATTQGASAGGATYILSADFETGTQGSWTWNASYVQPVWNHTPANTGSYSLGLLWGSTRSVAYTPTWASTNSVEIIFSVKLPTLPTTVLDLVYNTGGTGIMRIGTAGQVIAMHGGTVTGASAIDTIPANTPKYVKIQWIRGTSGNTDGITRIYVSDSLTFSETPTRELLTGAYEAIGITSLQFMGRYANAIIDDLTVENTEP